VVCCSLVVVLASTTNTTTNSTTTSTSTTTSRLIHIDFKSPFHQQSNRQTTYKFCRYPAYGLLLHRSIAAPHERQGSSCRCFSAEIPERQGASCRCFLACTKDRDHCLFWFPVVLLTKDPEQCEFASLDSRKTGIIVSLFLCIQERPGSSFRCFCAFMKDRDQQIFWFPYTHERPG